MLSSNEYALQCTHWSVSSASRPVVARRSLTEYQCAVQGLQSLTRNGSTMAAQLAAARANGSSGSHKPAAANGSADASASKQARLVPLTASRARKPSFDASSSSQAEDPSPPATTPLKGSPVSTTSSAEGVPAIPDSPLQKEPLQQVLENGHGSAAHLLPVSSAEGVEGSQPPAVAVPAAEAPRPGKVWAHHSGLTCAPMWKAHQSSCTYAPLEAAWIPRVGFASAAQQTHMLLFPHSRSLFSCASGALHPATPVVSWHAL